MSAIIESFNANFLLIAALAFAIFLVVFAFVPIIFFWGAVYLPTQKQTVKKMIELAKIKPGEKAVDLGSGDGRLVIALAKSGAEAHGFEINPILVLLARINILRAGLRGKAFVHCRSFWNENFSEFDIVVIFGIGHIMDKLGKKLDKELKKGTRVVSNSFLFPNWQLLKKETCVFLYEK